MRTETICLFAFYSSLSFHAARGWLRLNTMCHLRFDTTEPAFHFRLDPWRFTTMLRSICVTVAVQVEPFPSHLRSIPSRLCLIYVSSALHLRFRRISFVSPPPHLRLIIVTFASHAVAFTFQLNVICVSLSLSYVSFVSHSIRVTVTFAFRLRFMGVAGRDWDEPNLSRK